MLPISLEPIPISQSEESVEDKEENSQIFDKFRFDQFEVTILEHNSTPILDHDLPIALRKGTRECTKRPLYPWSHFGLFRDFP